VNTSDAVATCTLLHARDVSIPGVLREQTASQGWTTFDPGSPLKPPEGGGLLNGNPALGHLRFSPQIIPFL
jgi:hypothetical protein